MRGNHHAGITQSAAKASRPYHIPLPAKIKPQPFDGAGDR